MSDVIKLFPTAVYRNTDYKLSKDEIDIINHVGAFAKINDGNNLTSHERYLFDNYKELSNFKKYCQEQVDEYAHNILKIHEKQKFYITQSWVNVNTPNTHHHAHFHLNSLISAVYFVTDKSSPIKFMKSALQNTFPLFEFTMKEYIDINSDSWSIENTANTLLLFPSSLKHFVPPNEQNFNRVSLSFNTFIKGKIGEIEKATELIL